MFNWVLLALLCIVTALTSSCKERLTGRVIKVADGDTFTILTADLKQVKIRLYGIDCPEKKQAFGTRAKQFTSQLAYGKNVRLDIINKDRYGRLITVVYLPDGKVLNKELLKAGLAWHFLKYDQSEEYALLQRTAQIKKLGVWSMPDALAPWEYRKTKRPNMNLRSGIKMIEYPTYRVLFVNYRWANF